MGCLAFFVVKGDSQCQHGYLVPILLVRFCPLLPPLVPVVALPISPELPLLPSQTPLPSPSTTTASLLAAAAYRVGLQPGM